MIATRSGRWLLILFSGVVILIVTVIALSIAGLFAKQSADAAQGQRVLAAYREKIGAHARLETELAALNRQLAATDTLLQGESTALAAASMQNLVKELVERHGGQVRSAQTLAPAVSGGLEKITVQYELTVPLGSLKAVSYELETGTPYLMLDAAEVRPEVYGGTSAPANLHLQWTVHGYREVRP
jgi:general secretion pathway protein M